MTWNNQVTDSIMCGSNEISLKRGRWRKTGVDEGNYELTFLHIVISVRSEIPLGMVKKLKGIVYLKRCGGITY